MKNLMQNDSFPVRALGNSYPELLADAERQASEFFGWDVPVIVGKLSCGPTSEGSQETKESGYTYYGLTTVYRADVRGAVPRPPQPPRLRDRVCAWLCRR